MAHGILVPVDYSERSRKALSYANTLASRIGAELTVLHAWDCPPFARNTHVALASSDEQVPLDRLLQGAAQRELERFVASAALEPAVKKELVLSPSSPIKAVLEAVNARNPELIVMGTHGRGAAVTWFLGSVARRVVELSTVPVLLVPDATTRSPATSAAGA